MVNQSGNFGIIVSGGPAPGINSVIASVVFTAHSAGYKVFGFEKGMSGLIKNGAKTAIELTEREATSIQNEGGSILITSRHNPFESKESSDKFLSVIKELNIDKLVLIGGEGTAYLSLQISRLNNGLQVVHVPKTIDNDLILPNQYPSFGFETARYVGTQLMTTIRTETKTTNRWFVVKTMGRNAGFLALGLGISSGASVTVVPEQFGENITVDDIVDVIMPSVKKRYLSGKHYGTAVIAEGLIDKLDPEKVPALKSAPRDAIGRLLFSEVNLEDLIVHKLAERVHAEKLDIRFKAENIGYVLRCAPPVAFDIEYTRFLGYGAVKLLLQGKSGVMVVRDYDKLDYVELESMTNQEDRIQSRQLDINSDLYKVASNFMIK